MDWFQIFLTSTFLLVSVALPGIALSFALFPKRDQISFAERIGISFILGFIPPLILYFLTKNASVPINTLTSTICFFLVTAAGIGIFLMRKNNLMSQPQ